MDTIVLTWTGCSIPDIRTALGEMRRVLKPGGRLLFVEHGRAPEAGVVRWQDRLDPFWHRFSGGCRLNRKTDDLLFEAGFRIDRLEIGYIPGPRSNAPVTALQLRMGNCADVIFASPEEISGFILHQC